MNDPKLALRVSGTIFLFVSFLHIVRLFLHIQVVAHGHRIPVWGSAIGFVFTFALAIWMFRSARAVR
jgi:hypothetical protein